MKKVKSFSGIKVVSPPAEDIKKVEPLYFEDILKSIPDVNKLSDEQLKRLVACKREIETRQEKYAIIYYKPQPHQTPFHKSNKKLRLCSGANQCLSGDEYVYLEDGIKRADEVKDGDKITGGVVSGVKKFNDVIYEVLFDNSIKIKVNGKHPFFWRKSSYYKNGDWQETEQIYNMPKQIKCSNKGYVFFKSPDDVAKEGIKLDNAKLLGYLTSDGYISLSQSIKFTNINTLFLKEVEDLALKHFGISAKWYKKGKGYDLLLTNKKNFPNPIKKCLNEMGITNDSFGEILKADKNSLVEFIKGYFNGDGYLLIRKCKDRNNLTPEIGFCVGNSRNQAYELQYILWRLGVMSYVREEYFDSNGRKFYRVKVNSCDTEKIIKLLDWAKYPEKFVRALEAIKCIPSRHIKDSDGGRWVRITDVKKIGDGDVIGWQTIGTNEITSYCGMRMHNSGKSLSSVIEGIWISLGIHPYKKIKVPNRGRVVASDIQKGLGENIQNIYDKYCPKSEINAVKRYPGGQISKIIYNNGSTVDFLSYEQDDKMFEGWVGDWATFDEPPPRNKFVATMRGLMRYNGICWMALTPLSEPWIYDEIYTQAGASPSQPDVFVFDILDNKYLSKEQIEDFEKRLTPDEKEARLHGRFKHLSGLIYKEIKPDTHIIDDFEIPNDWTRYCAMDYHPRTPCAVAWIAVDPKGRFYVYDELWIDKTIKEISDVINGKEDKKMVRARFIDPLSATPDRITGSSPQREFARSGLHFRSARKDWVTGKNAVHEALKLDKENKPGLFFFKNGAAKVINAFLRYQWDEYSDNREGEKETPKKKFAHFPDVVRYMLVERPTYQNRQKINYPQQEYEGHKYTGYSFA